MDSTDITTALLLSVGEEDPSYTNYQTITQYTEGHIYMV